MTSENTRLDRPFLVGKRVYLRPLDMDDVNDEYLQWMNDGEIARFIPAMSFPNTRQRVEQYLRTQLDNPAVVFFAVVENGTGKHIGNVKLGPIDWISRRAEYGRLIGDPAARSKGYGSEIVRLILKYAFDTLNLHKVIGICMESNLAAIRSNEKCGLEIESRLKEYKYVNGHYEDHLIMGITKKKYYSLNEQTPPDDER